MRLTTVQSALAAAVALQLGMAQAAPPSTGAPMIGMAVAKGSFRVDNATVSGNSTLFDGATLETSRTGSDVDLSSGARLTLGADSKATIYGDRLILTRGRSHLEKATGFHMEAGGLKIMPETGNSSATVLLAANTNTAPAKVRVAALSGSLRVLNARGMVVARLPQGLVLSFEPQASNVAARLTGTLVNKGGHFLLTDETTNVTVEVAGAGLDKMVGKRVEVTGATDPAATPISDASQFVRVTSVKALPGAGTAPAGAGGSAGASGAAVSTTTIALIGGVAAAAVVGGLAATGNLGQDEGTISR